MKTSRFVIAIIFLACFCHANAQTKETEALTHLMNLSAVHWNNGDIEAYVDMYAPGDSTRMIYNGGTVYGKKGHP